ncbi:MAG TPA: hypothetical protein VFK05_02135 [Polyangiaceae bacterium]|nr:hypothetical protein [Polyangiaceae bacterium]
MRAMLGKLSVLVLAAGLAGSAIVTGCSSNGERSESSKDQGSIGFQLDVGGGATINTMHVIVYGNSLGSLGAATNIVRDLDVGAISGNSTAFTLTLPAGSNYQVKLSSPDNASCGGTGTFNVIAGQSNASTIAVTLSCTSVDNTGGETVNVNACTPPAVNSVFIGPNTQAVGHKIQLIADVESGSTIQWTATGTGTGTFDNSAAATANFTCSSAGSVSIQLGLTKNGCSTSKSYAVTCSGTGGGQGGAGGASGGSAGSVSVAGGGAGGSDLGGSGGSVAGGGTGGSVVVGGSGGSVAGGGSGGSVVVGGSGGTGGGAPSCPGPVNNSSTVGNATTVCSAAFAIDECGTNCAQITSNACQACELADATSCYDDGDNTDGSSLLNMKAALAFYGGANDDARVSKGIAAEQCFYKSGCAKQPGQIFTTCYCGTSGGNCTTPGAANGPCKAEIEAAAESTAPLDIASRIGDPSFPAGIAQVRVACDKTQCASTCLP